MVVLLDVVSHMYVSVSVSCKQQHILTCLMMNAQLPVTQTWHSYHEARKTLPSAGDKLPAPTQPEQMTRLAAV